MTREQAFVTAFVRLLPRWPYPPGPSHAINGMKMRSCEEENPLISKLHAILKRKAARS